jgi:hypothetical protein
LGEQEGAAVKIIGQRTGLVFPDDVRTMAELCAAERAAAPYRLPSGDPEIAEKALMDRIEEEVQRGIVAMRETRETWRRTKMGR